MNNDKDVAALESVSVAKNYNKYVFELFLPNIDESEHILDFGAGYGLMCDAIKKFGLKISSLEINPKAIKELEAREIKNYLDFNNINEKIDCIISLNVLEHLDNDDSYIKKFYDFLPHNGKLVLYLPSSQIIWSNLDDLVNHKRRYSKKGLEKLLVSNNFKIQRIHFVDFIGWSVLLLSKLLNLRLDFDQKKIIFYDRFIFKSFKFFDILFKNLIGKNLFVVATKS